MLSTLILSLMAVSTLNSTAQIQDYVTYRAMDANISPTIPLAIIKAESNFDINAKNPTSTASGLAQYINGTYKGYCLDKYKLATDMTYKNNPYIQVECLVRMLSEDGGIKHWDSSKGSWQKSLNGD